jgi:hypothetical protein
MKTKKNDAGGKDELAGMRQELADLEVALVRQDPPLDDHTRGIARAKIAILRQRINELDEKRAQGS